MTKTATITAIASLKGGQGKTTTAVNIAEALARNDKKVLLVDCDTQNQACFFLGVEAQQGLGELLLGEGKYADYTIQARKNLDLIPAGDRLPRAARDIALREIAQEKVLSQALAEARSVYDHIIIDTSPGWDSVTVNALVFASYIFCPLVMEAASIKSFGRFRRRLKPIMSEHPHLRVNLILPTKFNRRLKQPRNILEQMQKAFPAEMVLPIRRTVRFAESVGAGKTIFEMAAIDYTAEGAADDYAAFLERAYEVWRNE